MPSDSRSSSDSPFPRFERVMKALVQVPKKKIERKAARTRARGAQNKKRSKHGG
ncbi:MAG: hypothetical protein WA993_03120 [Candidatus Binatus sp.]|jgi:hypothetical protein|uniref:hypothetical protein n=1 Tax=Candidatus Binatus sp. TaxID=2811406 RepID=UPI003C9CFABB